MVKKEKTNCLNCEKEFDTYKNQNNNKKYCCKKCYHEEMKGIKHSGSFKEGHKFNVRRTWEVSEKGNIKLNVCESGG